MLGGGQACGYAIDWIAESTPMAVTMTVVVPAADTKATMYDTANAAVPYATSATAVVAIEYCVSILLLLGGRRVGLFVLVLR